MPVTPRSATRPAASSYDADQALWASMLGHLRANNADICRQWFEDIEPLGIVGGVMQLRAHTGIHREYLHRQCAQQFSEAARAASGRLLSVRFFGPDDQVRPAPKQSPPAPSHAPGEPAPLAHDAVPRDGAAATPAPGLAHHDGSHTRITNASAAGPASEDGHKPRANWNALASTDGENGTSHSTGTGPSAGTSETINEMAALARPFTPKPEQLSHLYDDGLVLNPDYGFDNFIVGPGNRLAHSAAVAVAQNPGRAYNPYFVHGDVGLGKTHILQAICLKIRQVQPGAVIYYTSCEGFMTQFMEAVQAGAMAMFRHKFRHVDVLVIDDIHFLAKRDRTQEEFFHTFNSLYQTHKQIVLSSDAPPEEIPDLEDRLVSRFKWGLVCNITPPCYETRVEILKNKAALRGVALSDEAACLVAARIDTNIRELEGAITNLQARSRDEGRPIDAALVREALGEPDPKVEPKIQIQTIINAVTDFYGVKVTDLQSKRRQRSIALPRQMCMFLARRNTGYSLEEIGGYFGGRDHTTVMHAVRTIEERRDADGEFANVVRTLEDKLRAPA